MAIKIKVEATITYGVHYLGMPNSIRQDKFNYLTMDSAAAAQMTCSISFILQSTILGFR